VTDDGIQGFVLAVTSFTLLEEAGGGSFLVVSRGTLEEVKSRLIASSKFNQQKIYLLFP
jgi:hypothetical protein